MPKEKIMISIDRDVLGVVDQICTELEVARSQFIEVALENALCEWRFMTLFGMRPARMKRLARAFQRIGIFRSGDYEIVVPDGLEKRNGIEERKES